MSDVLRHLRPLVAPLLVLLAHVLTLQALVRLDVVGRLLGAAATPPLGLLAVVAVFYVLRVFAYFVVPGWLLCRMVGVAAAVMRLNGSPP